MPTLRLVLLACLCAGSGAAALGREHVEPGQQLKEADVQEQFGSYAHDGLVSCARTPPTPIAFSPSLTSPSTTSTTPHATPPLLIPCSLLSPLPSRKVSALPTGDGVAAHHLWGLPPLPQGVPGREGAACAADGDENSGTAVARHLVAP